MTAKILVGDCREVLASLPDKSVQCCVTSPPYFGLRSYLPTDHPDKAQEMGLETTVDDYVAQLVAVFREVRRVLRDDGTLWLNLGDSYSSQGGAKEAGKYHHNTGQGQNRQDAGQPSRSGVPGLKPKDLIGIPWRVAFALQSDGWWLRSEITWCKKAPMPESVRDRPTSATEKVFLLSKQPRYFYDAEAVKEEAVSDHGSGNGYKREARLSYDGRGNDQPYVPQATRNMRNFWLLGPEPFPLAHFATYPTALVEPCIKAGTSERGCCGACGTPWVRVTENGQTTRQTFKGSNGQQEHPPGVSHTLVPIERKTIGWQPGCECSAGEPAPCVVLDPFGGSGTVGMVANWLGRDSILIELNPEYIPMIERRVATPRIKPKVVKSRRKKGTGDAVNLPLFSEATVITDEPWREGW